MKKSRNSSPLERPKNNKEEDGFQPKEELSTCGLRCRPVDTKFALILTDSSQPTTIILPNKKTDGRSGRFQKFSSKQIIFGCSSHTPNPRKGQFLKLEIFIMFPLMWLIFGPTFCPDYLFLARTWLPLSRKFHLY